MKQTAEQIHPDVISMLNPRAPRVDFVGLSTILCRKMTEVSIRNIEAVKFASDKTYTITESDELAKCFFFIL